MAAKFGTSGLRGLVEDIIDGTCEKYVRGYLRHLKKSKLASEGSKLYIGYDFRASSPQICQQTMAAAIKEGFVPINCADIPTPALAHYAMQNSSASIMITGSHIPADRNGIKFYRPNGEINKTDEIAISSHALDIDLSNAKSEDTSAVAIEQQQATELFVKRYTKLLSADHFTGKRIGIYEHSSVARDILKEIFQAFGATIISLARSETFIPVDTEAVSIEVQKNLKKWTIEHRLDAIMSTDGDGDRPLLSDEFGDYIKGDVLGLIASQYLKADMLATPVSSNSGIQSKVAGKVFQTRVGSPYVIEAIQQAQSEGGQRIVGFEANGGFLLASTIDVGLSELLALPTRDCVLPMLANLALCVENNVTLSELVKSYDLPVTQSGRIQDFPTEISLAFVKSLTDDADKQRDFFEPLGQITHTDTTDGLRVSLQDNQVVHLRPSGNAPEMRCYVEANDLVKADELVAKTIQLIKQYNGIE